MKQDVGGLLLCFIMLGSQGGTQMGLDDPQLPGGLARLAAKSLREALGSMGVKRRDKVTAFNQEAQDAR
jgi:hypothetical protein